ncbi:sensor histidine kinase [Demequina soli]|uniref:sensor histidine kinase n=1 Tax=Demequina soli TaxID=1638987 RepID=UPI0007814647|nr:histidine kinase [Demequina soli]
MIARRIGLCIAAGTSLALLPPALDIGADPRDGSIRTAVVAAVVVVALVATTLALLVPAWRGGRRASLIVAAMQVVGILTSLPAFLAPADVVPAHAVLLASAGSLLNVAAAVLIVLDYSTAMLYVAAVVVSVALYAATVAVASLAVPDRADRLVQTGAAVGVALLFHPLLTLMRRTVGRAVYGARVDPAGMARSLGRSLDRDGGRALAGALAEITGSLRLPGLAVLDAAGRVAGHVVPGGVTADLPLDDADGLTLRVTLRPGERRLGSPDRTALELVSLPLAQLVREAALAEDLRAARAATVDARERERASLHRDLHDGLGPLLTGATYRADAARNLVLADRHGDDAGEGLLAQLDVVRADLRVAVGELRRVVDGLRPVELDEDGLRGALARRADRVGASLEAPDPLPAVSPALEAAVYRIVAEALTNAERHAPGSRPRARLTAPENGGIAIEVVNALEHAAPARDDRRAGAGVGVASMRLRADELGGSADIGARDGEWRVAVWLPLPDSEVTA